MSLSSTPTRRSKSAGSGELCSPRTCTLEGCDRPVKAKGLCNRDYLRKRTFEASNHGVAWDPREAVKRGRPAKPYSADTVRKALASGNHPKCLRMASGKATLASGTLGIDESRKVFGYSDLCKQERMPPWGKVADYLKQPYKVGESTQSYRYAKRVSGQEECVTCQTGTREEHLHSQHVKPREVAAHLEVKPASPTHFTAGYQKGGNWYAHRSGNTPKTRHAYPSRRGDPADRRTGERSYEVLRPGDTRLPRDDMRADSKYVQAKLHGLDQGDFTN